MPGQLYENLRQLVSVVDELRDCGLQNYISLPRIAACGTQSSGKSSLIESVVGLDFLPRGGGVVTRRPLELRLVHLSTLEHSEGTAWAVFDKSQKKLTSFDQVRDEIERLTDEVAGANKGIVDDPIVLTVYATGTPDLTLIDLPGITRVPVKGSDQVADIEKLTREMTLRYIKDPRTIIMAVLPANQDISVSDALQMARQVDPKGLRTVGVVTKIDIMDQGTDACRMLRGDDIPLRLGYIGVKMRSQADIQAKKTVKVSLQEEKEWFSNHRVYSKLPPGMVGTNFLINNLTSVLFKHIRRFLPDIKREINDRRRDVEGRLGELGEGVPVEGIERVQLMWTMVADFTDMFKNNIRGKHDRRLQKYMHSNAKSESCGSRIRSIFNRLLEEYCQETITAHMTDEDIDDAIQKHEGDSLPGFPSPDTFEFLIMPHLKRILPPCLECVDTIATCLDELANRMALVVLRRFPKLSEAVLEMAANIIQREKESARGIVEQTLIAETNYLFTNDVDYLMSSGTMLSTSSLVDPRAQQQAGAPQKSGVQGALRHGADAVMDGTRQAYAAAQGVIGQSAAKQRSTCYNPQLVAEIRKRLDAYFSLVVRNARDVVPKATGYFLVRSVEDKLMFEIYSALKNDSLTAELLGEPPHIQEERKTLTAQLKTMQRASNVLLREPALASIAFDDVDVAPEEVAPSSAAAASRATPGPGPTPGPQVSRMSVVSATAASGMGRQPGSGGNLFGAGQDSAGSSARAPDGNSALFGAASARLSQGLDQAKQKVASSVVNQVASHVTSGAVKEVPAEVSQAALKYAENNPEKAKSAVKSLFNPLG